jgi:predicted Zn-dependent protease
VLQLLYEGSLLPAAIALITGDASQFGQIATVLPTILIESSYSRAVEQQADDDSATMMKRIGANPAALGNLLLRLEGKLCGGKGCSAGWLGSHPDAAIRAARLREEAKSERPKQ